MCLTYYSSERLQDRGQKGSLCPELRCRALHSKPRRKIAIPKHLNKDASCSGRPADGKEVQSIRLFLVMMNVVTTAHVPLDATNDQSISTFDHEGSSNGARDFHLHYLT